MLKFLSKYVYKMQLYLRPLYKILRQQKIFEWISEHQTRFEETKTLAQNKFQMQFRTQNNHFTILATPQTLASAQHY